MGDFGVTAHAEIVVAAPHGHVSLLVKRLRVVVCHWKGEGTAVHRLKNPVCVIRLLAFNLLFKKLVILEGDS